MKEQSTMPAVVTALIAAIGAWVALSPSLISVSGTAAYLQIAVGIALIVLGLLKVGIRSGILTLGVGGTAILLVATAAELHVSSAAQRNLGFVSCLIVLLAALDGYMMHRQATIYQRGPA